MELLLNEGLVCGEYFNSFKIFDLKKKNVFKISLALMLIPYYTFS